MMTAALLYLGGIVCIVLLLHFARGRSVETGRKIVPDQSWRSPRKEQHAIPPEQSPLADSSQEEEHKLQRVH